MHEISLKLDPREETGKKVYKLRRQGLVPSVVYGGKADPVSTQSDFVVTTKVVKEAGRHTPVHLTIDGKKKLAIIQSIDVDPVKHQVRHIAFRAIRQNQSIVTEVPVVLTHIGESEAEKASLVVLQGIENVEIKALPADLPESLEVSIEHLATTDDKLTLGDIKLPKGVEFADAEQDLSLTVANVYEPSALQAANDAAAGDAEDESSVESENGGDTDQDVQDSEDKPGGKDQDEPKQSNVDANK